MTDYDVIIIGGGIGGTAVGSLLATKQLKVLLIEKNDLIGGRCSTYEKDGFKVDVGVHSFARSHNGPIGKALTMVGMENAIDWSIGETKEARWHLNGNFYVLPDHFRKLISAEDTVGLLNLINETSKIKDTSKLDTTDVKSWLSQYTDNTIIHSYFSIVCGLYFVIPYYTASAGEFIRSLTSLNKYQSIGYPNGGCISIPLAFTEAINKLGGEIRTKTTVKKVIVEDNKVQGIELSNNEFISSNTVISNAGLKETVNNLTGRNFFEKDYLGTMDNLQYSLSAITLKIALNKPVTPYKIVVSFTEEDPEERLNSMLKGAVPDELDYFIPVPSNYHSTMAPKGKQILTAGTMVPKENFEKNRDKWIENLMNTLEKVFPELSKNLLWYDVTTPKDIESMYGKEASVIGLSQTIDQAGINRPPISLPINGLYMVGGDAGGWGIGTELAVKSALECSEIVLNKIQKFPTPI